MWPCGFDLTADAASGDSAAASGDGRWFDAQELDLEIQLREGVSTLAPDPFADRAGFRVTIASEHAALRWGTVSIDVIDAFIPFALGDDRRCAIRP